MGAWSATPDLDFRCVRPYGRPASRANGFEELASTLICRGVVAWPENVIFERFGNPDGGREGRGVLPNGDVWAWQTKYLFEFDDAAIAQISASVSRVLDSEPRLKKFFVALPIDLSAGDAVGPKRVLTSAHTKWENKCAEWKRTAQDKGLDVEFRYIGEHELVTALTEPQHAGRARYWFDTVILTPEEQRRRLEDVIGRAGRRYTPRLHVEVDAARALDALGRTDSYVRRWQDILASLRKSREYRWLAPDDHADSFREALAECASALDAADQALASVIAAAHGVEIIPDVASVLQQPQTSLNQIDDLLRRHLLQDGHYFVGEAGALYRNVSDARAAMQGGLELLEAQETAAANTRRLLLTGRAGVGKTHLLCDVASKRLDAGRPTVIVLGQDFTDDPPLPQIGRLAEIDGSLDELLDLLNAAGEAAGCVGLLMIDALNEGENPQRWEAELRVLSVKVARYPNVGFAVSCRTEFLSHVLGQTPDIPLVEHPGFAESTREAIDRYANEYEIDRPAFPVLNPEFSNPLFLKLTCEAITTLGQHKFTLGSAGLLATCSAFLEAVNTRLARANRCDYDDRRNLVVKVAHRLALSGPGPYEREDVQQITDEVLPGRNWSNSLFRELLSEGVLIETFHDHVAFGYQRVGDVLRASALAEGSVEDLAAWLHTVSPWQERGVIDALGVIVPERFGTELPDLAASGTGVVPAYAIDAFLRSLVLRAPDHVTDRTKQFGMRLTTNEDWAARTWEMLLRISCIPGHGLNAEWLHSILRTRSVADRDTTWSESLVDGLTSGSNAAVAVLLDWAFPPESTESTEPSGAPAQAQLPEDIATLATLALGWLLTTTDRRVRDRATKALVHIADRATPGFAAGIVRFRGCNDPYVIERLCAACCGAALRTTDPANLVTIADATAVLVADAWPTHILTRDYLRRVAAAAHEHGWTGPQWLPPFNTEWPVPAPSIERVEKLTHPRGWESYSSIWFSLTGLGDFGHYILDPALHDLDAADKTRLRSDAERAIFGRCLNLGWNPKQFARLDQGRHGGHDGKVERYGKKYQWIGFYETLGRITDHHQIREPWSSQPATAYTYPEQLVWRDIDPTVLIQPHNRAPQTPPWFAPATIAYPFGVVDDYPNDLNDVPDPLDLLAVSDPKGTRWLSLILHTSWTQELPPEVTALRAPALHTWVQIRSYLAPIAGTEDIRRWAAGQDWDGRWMPESIDIHNRLLGAHPASPDWDSADGSAEPRGHRDQRIPVVLTQCVSGYEGTGTSLDATCAQEPAGYVPTRALHNLLQLQHGIDFSWADASGPAVCNPSRSSHEPHTCLLRRDLTAQLADAGLTLMWTVLLNKQLNELDPGGFGEDYRWISASAAYLLADDAVERISAVATRHAPAGHSEPTNITWDLRPLE